MPVVAINIDGFFINALFFLIMQFFPPSAIIFWIWGLIKVMGDVQDWFAITYYVATFILFVPQFVFSVIKLSADIIKDRKSDTPKKSKHFKKEKYKQNSTRLLNTCRLLIKDYESPDKMSCTTDLMELINKRVLGYSEEIAEWEDSDTDYIKIAHTLLSHGTYDLLTSGKYHMFHGMLNPIMNCSQNLLIVYKRCMQWGVENGVIDEETRKEQLELLITDIQNSG